MNPELAALMQQMGPQLQAQGHSPMAGLPGAQGGPAMPGMPPSQPLGGGQGGPNLPWPMSPGQGGMNQGTTMAALAGIGFMKALEEMRKYAKAQNTVGMRLDKQTQVAPGTPGTGPADIQARAQAMGQQQVPGMGGGQPPGMGQGIGQIALSRMLAQPGQQAVGVMA